MVLKINMHCQVESLMAIEFALDVRLSAKLTMSFDISLTFFQDTQTYMREMGTRLEKKVDIVQQGIEVSRITLRVDFPC